MAVTNVNMKITQLSQDVTNNTSLVQVEGFATMTGSSYNDYTKTGTYIIDGTSYSFSTTLPKNTTKTLFSAQHTIKHDDYGKKTVYGSFSLATGISAGTISASTELTLTDIARATVCTNLSGTIGQTSKYYFNPANSLFYHELRVIIDYTEYPLKQFSSGETSGDVTIPTWLYSYLPTNATEYSYPLVLYTYYNGTEIGRNTNGTLTFYANLDEVKPIVTILDYQDVNETTYALTQDRKRFIKGFSTLSVNYNVKGQNGSLIQDVWFTGKDGAHAQVTFIEDTSETEGYFKTLNWDTDLFGIWSNGTRGSSDTVYQDTTLLAYFEPRWKSVDVYRPDAVGTEIVATLEFEYWYGYFGANNTNLNTISNLSWRVIPIDGREITEDGYSEWVTVTSGSATSYENEVATRTYTDISLSNPFDGNGEWDYTIGYQFQFRVNDKLVTSIYEFYLGDSEPLFYWYQVPDDYVSGGKNFNISGNSLIKKNLTVGENASAVGKFSQARGKDGDFFPCLDESIRHCITLKKTTNQTVTVTGNVLLEFDSMDSSVGEYNVLEFVDNGIRANEDCSVLVSATTWAECASGYSQLAIYKNGSVLISRHVFPALSSSTNYQYWRSHALSPTLVNMNAGDTLHCYISFSVANTSANRIPGNTYPGSTYMTVQQI